jgi:hypothetical protein
VTIFDGVIYSLARTPPAFVIPALIKLVTLKFPPEAGAIGPKHTTFSLIIIVLEIALIHGNLVSVHESALPVLLTMFKFPFIIAAVRLFVYAFPMDLTVPEVPFSNWAIRELINALPMWDVPSEIPRITLLRICPIHLTSSRRFIIYELSPIPASTPIAHDPLSMADPTLPVALIWLAISPEITPDPFKKTITKVAMIGIRPACHRLNALALSLAISEIAHIVMALKVDLPPDAVIKAVSKLATVFLTIYVIEDAISMGYTVALPLNQVSLQVYRESSLILKDHASVLAVRQV